MPTIDEDIVRMTWQSVAGYNEDQASLGMMRLGNNQEELLAFVTSSLNELSDDAIEIGVYIFFVVFCMFETSSQENLKYITGNSISLAYERNEDLLTKLEGAHDRFFERIASLEAQKQVNVTRYVLETIMESGEGEDPVSLSGEEVGLIYLTLKTAIDVLDQALE